MSKILIIDDDKSICKMLELYLTEEGFQVYTALRGMDGIKEMEKNRHRIVILDIRLPDMDGLSVLKRIKEIRQDACVIMITAFHDVETTVEAMKRGALEYIHKPINIEEVDIAVKKAIHESEIAGKTDSLITLPYTSRGEHTRNIIGKSNAMKEIFKTIGIISGSKTTVLIEGESGTGKEMIARAIHYYSADKEKPFVCVNCSAIVDTLLESELFGHEKGSFTGADFRKAGKFETANNGGIFLDEIGDMSINLQAKVLRVLQEKEFQRVGGNETIKTDVRIIAATNKSLIDLVKVGKFREDLYYRLKVVTIDVPPLRHRKEDIPLLVEYLLDKINLKLHKKVDKIPSDVMLTLVEYDWPGNVRELENILTRAVALSQGDILMKDNLFGKTASLTIDAPSENIKSLKDVEKEYIFKILQHTKWNKGKACELLGITYPTLREKIKEYELKKFFNHD